MRYEIDTKQLIEQTLRLDFNSNKSTFEYWLSRIAREISSESISSPDKAWLIDKQAKLAEIKRQAQTPSFLGSSARDF